MKRFLLVLFIISVSFAGYAQQRSLCQLFILGFNQANQDFPFIKPAPYDSLNNNISKDTLAFYGLSRGFISRTMNLNSKNYPGFTYSSHYFSVSSKGEFLEDGSFEQNKDYAYNSFTKFSNDIGKACLQELAMSEIYTNENFLDVDKRIWVCYFYPKPVNIPPGTSLTAINELLNEIPHIEINFSKRWLMKGYEMTYYIQGIQYNKK